MRQEGTENHAAGVPWAKDSAINSPCIPGPRTEVSQHVEPRSHGPAQGGVRPASKSWVGSKRPSQASGKRGRGGWGGQ